MTAEVAILNREAVAIAADSAVTLGGPVGKIYNTANKLFALSATEPVAVMVYGAGSFGPIPWDTVVKEYRHQLGAATHPTVQDYASAFVGYLSALVPHVPERLQRERVIMHALWELRMLQAAVRRAADRTDETGTPLNGEGLQAEVLEQINRRITDLRTGDYIEGLSDQLADREIRAAIDDWSAFMIQGFPELPRSAEIQERALVLVRTSLRQAQQSPWSAGVVIAGFGEDQVFPALSHYLIDGVVADCVRARRLSGVSIGGEHSAGIYPFAQMDMVQTFMDGLHPEYRLALGNFVYDIVGLVVDHFSEHVRSSMSATAHARLLGEMGEARSAIALDFQDRLDRVLESEHAASIMSIVEHLPKEELADMAEALVNLTSLRRRVTPDAETVGGPIDVAVISKGDGLVWIKRKQYFLPELNPRYFDRDRSSRLVKTLGGAQ